VWKLSPGDRITGIRKEDGLLLQAVTDQILGAGIEVHKALGPGLLESAYEQCLCHELTLRNVQFARQVAVPVRYKGIELDCGYRVDLLVEDWVVVELKAVDRLMPIHEAQLLTYLRLSEKRVGLLMNFNVSALRHGVVRRVL
jgi:GxxExxY protein